MRRAELLASGRSAGMAVFALWSLVTAAAFVVRPGVVLELATLGLVGALAWPLAAERATRVGIALAALFFLVPVAHTWPGRAWLGVIQYLPDPAMLLLGASSLLGVGVLVLAWRRPRLPRSWLLLVAVAALGLGAVASSAASPASAASAGAAWLAFVLPMLLGLFVTTVVATPAEAWRLLSLTLLGALVPVTMGVAAYVLVQGVPLSGADLAAGKAALVRPHLVHELTFGNPGHLIAFALLVLPAALIAATRPVVRPPVRVGAGLLLVGLVVVLALTLGRAAIVVTCALLASLALVAVLRRQRTTAAAAAASLAVLVGVSLTDEVRALFVELKPVDTPTRAGGVAVGGVVLEEGSAVTRVRALRSGLELSRRHAPWGVGTGRFADYDPVSGSPHSLAVLVLAENGVLGAVGLAALVAFLVVQAASLRRRPRDDFDVRLACTAGALGFLTLGVLAGAPLSVGVVAVWSILLWLQVGLLAALSRGAESG